MENLNLDSFAALIGFILLFSLLFLCRLAVAMKWLTKSGSVAAFFIALILLNSGIVMFYIPLVLLVGGTLLSKLNHNDKEKNGRNATQVLANGGIGVMCLLLNNYMGSTILFQAYIVSFSISVCDTFSSETGQYFNGKTIDILSFKPVKKGLSGGVSIAGTAFGIAGVVICSLISFYAFHSSIGTALLTGCFGALGMLLDSILGSQFQAKYINTIGEIGEDDADGRQLYSGYTWCTNNTVNFLSNIITVLLFVLIRNLF